MKKNIETIIAEITNVLANIDEKNVLRLERDIITANTIILVGAGRMGLAAKAFSMRLRQLGLESFALGDSAIPHVKKGDLMIVCSGSGETETVHTIAQIAKTNGCKIALITARKNSRIAQLAKTILIIPAHTKLDDDTKDSIQPMTTLMEQSTGLFFDAVVLNLMKTLKQTSRTMWKRHSNLE